MSDDDLKALFQRTSPAEADRGARARAMAAAREMFARENAAAAQGSPGAVRQTVSQSGLIARTIGRLSMFANRLPRKTFYLTSAAGMAVSAAIAAFVVHEMDVLHPSPFGGPDLAMTEVPIGPPPKLESAGNEGQIALSRSAGSGEAQPPAPDFVPGRELLENERQAEDRPEAVTLEELGLKEKRDSPVDWGQRVRVRRGTSLGASRVDDSPEARAEQLRRLRSELEQLEQQENDSSGNVASNLAPATPGVVAEEQRAGQLGMAHRAIIAAEPPAVIEVPLPRHYRDQSRDRFANADPNPFKTVGEAPVSTFSIDVDTASYSFARRALMQGRLPDPASVRVEEMINYFDYSYAPPVDSETPFATHVEIADTPWNEATKLLRIGIKGYEIPAAERPASNVVFLIDTSGSMNSPDKLPLLLSSFRLLIDQLDERDSVAIVTYAGHAGVALEPTPASNRAAIRAALDRLHAGGSTAGAAGIATAYQLAEQSFVDGGVNRVILATDGDFNVGVTNTEALKRLVEDKRRSGVMLSVLGFGQGNLNDALMQTLAQNGNGQAAYIDSLAEAQKVLVEEAGSTLFPIAKDVKIQLEFNPATVSEYRLIGYETRALKREDFNNDKIDAGEIGSGHTVTALYEFTPAGAERRQIDGLRYQAAAPAPEAEATAASDGREVHADEYAFLKLRYKAPDGDVSKLIGTPVTKADEAGTASDDTRFAAAVAAYGQLLRGSHHLGSFGFDEVLTLATEARGADPYGHRGEFLRLVQLARSAR